MFGIPKHLLREVYVRNVGIVMLAFIIPNIAPELESGSLEAYFKSYIYTFVFWQGNCQILLFFRRKFPRISDTVKRIGLTIAVASNYTILMDPLLSSLFHEMGMNRPITSDNMFDHIYIDLIATLIIGALYESNYFFSNWKKTLVETEKLKNQNLRSQLDVLKNQISPHFLFNSLNTLTALIPEDPKYALEFTEKLSQVYRYILQYKERELIDLKTELEFTRSYTYLLKMRFNKAVHFDYEIDEKYLSCHVAPLSLQMLIENALKHNVTSLSKPLKVDIYVQNGRSMVVRNNLQPKKTVNDSTHTGLSNIRRRYKYLSERNVDVITTAHHFMVSLPLIELEEIEPEKVTNSI